MKKIYIFTCYLEYGTADCNRLFAYATGLLNLGYDVKIVAYAILKLNEYREEEGFEIIKPFPTRIRNGVLRFIVSRLWLPFFLLSQTKRTDPILLYGSADDIPSFMITRRQNIWHEVTECPEIAHPIFIPLRIYYKLCKRINGLFVISQQLKSFYINKGIPAENIHVINMIVDSKRFENIQSSRHSEKYIAYCGTVSKGKDGIDLLLKAFVKYHQHFPNRHLAILGPFWNDCSISDFNNLLPTSVKPFVKFAGRVSPDEIPGWLCDAEMLVLARPKNKQSRYGFPTKLGEYLLTGNPVIVTTVGDISLFLHHKENALLTTPGDISELVECMKWISENPMEAKKMGINGATCAREKFNNINECKKIINAISSNV